MFKTGNSLLFIHIPKTAGSSFRQAAETYFGHAQTIYDYGEKSSETHQKIIEFEYQNKDRFAAGEFITKQGRFLSGHIPYLKYAPFFHPKNVITFVRSPEQQVRSHFEHYIRHHGYTKSFQNFIVEKRFCNMQSRILQGISTDAFGFIGLTERYGESLELINRSYNTELIALNVNQNTSKDSSPYTFSEKDFALIKSKNTEDFALYEYAIARFERQKNAIVSKQPFIRVGKLNLPPKQAEKKFNGWVTCYETDQVQELDIIINNKIFTKITGNEYRGLPNERNMNRAGFIGFSFDYPTDIKLNDLVQFRTLEKEVIYSFKYLRK